MTKQGKKMWELQLTLEELMEEKWSKSIERHEMEKYQKKVDY